MLRIKLIDKIPNLKIRERTKINDIIEEITKLKWQWPGHVVRMKDNRWTVRCIEWQVRDGKRSKEDQKEGGEMVSKNICEVHCQEKSKDRHNWKDLAEGYFQQ